MTHRNRLIKFIESRPPRANCVVISDTIQNRVMLSFSGNKLLWHWIDGGLVCPGSTAPMDIHPLAAEALIVEEIMSLIRMEGVTSEEIVYVNEGGENVGGIMFNPEIDGFDFDVVLKKEKIKDLYERFVAENDELTEEIIGEAISFGVLSPFLTLVNL